MSIDISFHDTAHYYVSTPVFAGPLDLLLHLIERQELDITKLSLAQVTDQYLVHMKHIQDLSPEEVSAFILIAAKLIQIKSEALLPLHKENLEVEEDIGESLARQLQNYKRYKDAAEFLAGRQEEGLHAYLRLASVNYQRPTIMELNGINIETLFQAAITAFNEPKRNNIPTDMTSAIKPPKVTVLDKIKLLNRLLRHQPQLRFQSLFEQAISRVDVMVTFLAMLELIKRHYIRARQESLFGDIFIEVSQDWDINEDFELEFE